MLINCPECSKEISDSAKICPNCGYKIKKSKKPINKKLILKIAISMVILIILGLTLKIFLPHNVKIKDFPIKNQLFKLGVYKKISYKDDDNNYIRYKSSKGVKFEDIKSKWVNYDNTGYAFYFNYDKLDKLRKKLSSSLSTYKGSQDVYTNGRFIFEIGIASNSKEVDLFFLYVYPIQYEEES